jgi:hypothetical protein
MLKNILSKVGSMFKSKANKVAEGTKRETFYFINNPFLQSFIQGLGAHLRDSIHRLIIGRTKLGIVRFLESIMYKLMKKGTKIAMENGLPLPDFVGDDEFIEEELGVPLY